MPIGTNGDKMPAFDLLPRINDRPTWGVFQRRRPKKSEVRSWFASGEHRMPGIAIIAGSVSDNLEIMDFDNADVFRRWEIVMRKLNPQLLRKLVWVRSPRPGFHAYFRCETIGGNQKLAQQLQPPGSETRYKTLIEIKGNGGYCVAPPSPSSVHASGKRYRFLTGRDFTMIESITPEERDLLFSTAREFDEVPPPKRTKRRMQTKQRYTGRRPGDQFNEQTSWQEILEPAGWECVSSGDEERWRRPGKDHQGCSATTNYNGSDLLYVFSSNAEPFEPDMGYSKFAAFALLEHGGNFKAAARALRKKHKTRSPLRTRSLRDKYKL
jgi:putative DNA primase/helicase